MGLSPYVVGGLASGIGQGIDRGVGTIVAARKEEEAKRHQLEQERHQREQEDIANRRLDESAAQNKRLIDRQLFGEDVDFTQKGGVIEDDPNDNGTGSIGMHVGISTATTQPSEHQHDGVTYRTVGSHGGKRYELPADGLTPAERLKQRGRESRASAVTGFKNYKPTDADLSLLSDPEHGDEYLGEISKRDWALDPRNINAQARVAGARAEATYPFRNHSGADKDADGLTPAQRRTIQMQERRLAISEHTGNSNEAKAQVREYKDPDKTKSGWKPGIGFLNPDDSTAYEDTRHKNFGLRTEARLRAGAEDADAGNLRLGREGSPAAKAKREAIYKIYKQAWTEAKTREEQQEAEDLYRSFEEQTLADEGRAPTIKRKK